MARIEIRALEGEELIEVSRLLGGYAFDPTPPLPDLHDWQRMIHHLRDATYLVLFEDSKAVATAAYTPMSQQVRGHIYPANGVWGVATHPEARRKGYARQVLLQLFAEVHAVEMPLSNLYPFRESFYSRLGYTTFPQARKVRFSPQALLPLLKCDLEGRVELKLIADGFDEYRTYLRKQQRLVHGMGLFSGQSTEMTRERNDVWLALARAGGEVVGAMLYKIKARGETEALDMVVSRFYYSDVRGRYLLLDWFARHADQITEVEIKLPSAELPETWFPDMSIKLEGFEPPMARVLDVTNIGGMQSGEGSFSARILDPHCPWNEGNHRFETRNGHLHVSPASIADCDLTINGLSALVYGTHSPGSFGILGWGNPSPDMQATMQVMFAPMLPYLHEVF